MSMAASPLHFNREPIVVVMGVCGCGKSTVGKLLAERLNLPFLEGDEFHPESNVNKMAQGIPLTDEDRSPWLATLGKAIADQADQHGGAIASCSALKRNYRKLLEDEIGSPMIFAFLDGSRETLIERMTARQDHYMPASLLDSQLADLETPGPDEAAIYCSIEEPAQKIVDAILASIGCEKRG